MIRTSVCAVTLSMLAGTAFAQCGGAQAQAEQTPRLRAASFAAEHEVGTVVEVAKSAGSFNTLVAAIEAAGLAGTLSGDGPFTVFAPTDEAFAKLPAGTVESLLKPENKAKLVSILTYHVVPANVPAKSVRTMPAPTVGGQRLDVVAKDGKVTVDGANVVKTDVMAKNGVIHVIDRVLMPADKNLVQTAVAAGSFKTLAMLIEKAGLADTLSGPGPFTVFAPTDEAFAKLPKETVESLLKPENKAQLAKILTFHVVQGRTYSDAVASKGWRASTVQGGELTSKETKGAWSVAGSGITATDIDASNGVIHVIDTVMMPK
ncbi:MAG: fasciclin domain-containing protein [Leptolyngbya sp. PLA1]|nr:fasciclin domain-containing protein [Leptolyngbya sp. PLA1]